MLCTWFSSKEESSPSTLPQGSSPRSSNHAQLDLGRNARAHQPLEMTGRGQNLSIIIRPSPRLPPVQLATLARACGRCKGLLEPRSDDGEVQVAYGTCSNFFTIRPNMTKYTYLCTNTYPTNNTRSLWKIYDFLCTSQTLRRSAS